jgi:hypothetical protein
MAGPGQSVYRPAAPDDVLSGMIQDDADGLPEAGMSATF